MYLAVWHIGYIRLYWSVFIVFMHDNHLCFKIMTKREIALQLTLKMLDGNGIKEIKPEQPAAYEERNKQTAKHIAELFNLVMESLKVDGLTH